MDVSRLPENVAWVVFCSDSDVPWLKILKRGFRHCLVIWHDGRNWICVDPLSHVLDIQVIEKNGLDMPTLMREQGHVVVRTYRKAPLKIAPPDILSCVSLVKRALGIHKFSIITPWQLYRHLVRENNAQNFNSHHRKNTGDLSWEL